MTQLKPLLVKAGPTLAAVLAGFVGGWSATVTQAVCAQPAKVLSLNQLNLIDAEGKKRGMLSGGPSPSLEFLRADGTIGLSLKIRSDSSAILNLNQGGEKSGLVLKVEERGLPFAALYDKDGNGKINLGVIGDNPSFLIRNKQENGVVFLGVDPFGAGYVSVYDANNNAKHFK